MENNELELILAELKQQQEQKQQSYFKLLNEKLDQAELLAEKTALQLQNLSQAIEQVKQLQQNLAHQTDIDWQQVLAEINQSLTALSENNSSDTGEGIELETNEITQKQNALIQQRLKQFLELEIAKQQQQIQLPLRALDFAIAELNSTFTPIQQKVENKLSGLATKLSRKFQASKLLLAKQLEKGAVRLRQQKTAG